MTSWTSDTHAALPRPVIKVVIKDMARLPTDEAVMAAVADAESAYYGGTLARRGPDFNVFLEPPVDASGLAVSYVLGGRSPKELKRVVARARGASAQLLAENVRGLTGILHAGVHSEDDARDIRALLLPEFDRGTLRGIAAVILSVRRLLVDPSGNVPAMRTAWCVNPRAERPLTRNLPFAMFYGIFKAPHLPPGSEVQVGFIERHDMLTSEMLA